MKTDKKYKIIADLSMRIVYLIIILFVLIISFLIYYLYKPTIKEPEKLFVCGNALEEDRQRQQTLLKYGENIDFDNGGKLYKQNCAVCHSLGTNRLTGPGLEGVTARVPSEKWLFNYISNSDSLFKLEDPYTLKLRSEYPDERMPSFKHLTDKEVTEIISYISSTPTQIVN